MHEGLTLNEVSQVTGRSIRTIRRWIAEGHLKTRLRQDHEPPNTPTLIESSELESFLASTRRLVHTCEMASTHEQEQIYQQLRAEMLPMINDLRQEMQILKDQIEHLQQENYSLTQKLQPAKTTSPWRKLLGVE